MRNVVLICVSLTLTCPCIAGTITVDDDGPADFNNIQDAINDANDGDTVLVKDGTYTGTGNRDIDFLGKAITVRSENGPGSCVIDCENSSNGFNFDDNEDGNSVLDGFTITGGWSPLSGGAIFCWESSPTITNCNITGNFSFEGGAVYGYGSEAKITNCNINGNEGGGVHFRGGNSIIRNCNISRNVSSYVRRGVGGIFASGTCLIENCTVSGNKTLGGGGGGGIICIGDSKITGCIITGNSSRDDGGGIYCLSDNTTIKNCVIAGNSAEHDGGGIYCHDDNLLVITGSTIADNSAEDDGGGIYCRDGEAIITNCILYSNEAAYLPQIYTYSGDNVSVTYCNIQDGWTGQGNIDAHPGFAFIGDYHLMPGSPCIDAGTNDPCGGLPATDLDGVTRPLDGDGDSTPVADMGAYEHDPTKPTIAVSTRNLYFVHSWPRDSQTLQIRNCGGGILNWRIAEDCNWMEVSPQAGTSNSDIDQVEVIVRPVGLATGSYYCTLEVIDPNASNNPVNICLELLVGTVLDVPSHDYPTIQSAIDAAEDYDVVFVADGVYTGDGNRDLDFKGKAIGLKSQNGPEHCIIDCNGTRQDQHRGVYFYNDEGPDSLLTGFTIRNAFDWDGGAISCRNSSPTIENCIFSNNTNGGTMGGGGGISCWEGSPKITNCAFTGNVVERGGGIECYYSSPIITNCTFTNNTAFNGGGISCSDSNPKISNCKFTSNVAAWGGGIYCSRSNPTITSCTITGNSAGDEGGGIYAAYNSNLTVKNCILWSNTAILGNEIYLDAYYSPYSEYISEATVSYSDVEAGADSVYVEPNSILNWNQGNIDADPCFVEAGYWVDVNDPNIIVEPDDPNAVWIDGDYHLLTSSPCIDTGDPNYIPEPNETDLDGNPRILNSRIDMGAYEYTPPVQVEVKLTPQMLSCDSRGRWLKAHVTLPEEIFPEDIDVNTPAVANPPGVESEFIEVFDNGNGQFDVQIYFDRESFCDALSESEDGLLEVTVTGSLTDGRKFQGADTIKLKSNPFHHRRRNSSGKGVEDEKS